MVFLAERCDHSFVGDLRVATGAYVANGAGMMLRAVHTPVSSRPIVRHEFDTARLAHKTSGVIALTGGRCHAATQRATTLDTQTAPAPTRTVTTIAAGSVASGGCGCRRSSRRAHRIARLFGRCTRIGRRLRTRLTMRTSAMIIHCVAQRRATFHTNQTRLQAVLRFEMKFS